MREWYPQVMALFQPLHKTLWKRVAWKEYRAACTRIAIRCFPQDMFPMKEEVLDHA